MEINDIVKQMKDSLENVIKTAKYKNKKYENGLKAKEAYIRSQKLIMFLHEYIKEEFWKNGIDEKNIFPPIGKTKPELKLCGFLKKKNQDITIINRNFKPKETNINWGPLAYEGLVDDFGKEYTEKCLIINVRSQLSSVAKNTDTLFERTFAEALNLHIVYPNAVLGEVYLIPVYEYDEELMNRCQVGFKRTRVNIEKYISFFNSISNRKNSNDELYKYERAALLIVDFAREFPKVYTTHDELVRDGVVSSDFRLSYDNISILHFAKDLLEVYKKRNGEIK